MSEHPHHQLRKRVYIDPQLQGRLLVALIVLEVSMLALSIGYLYLRFDGIIETNLYTIHGSSREALSPVFIQALLQVIGVMSVVNTLALLAAHLLWSRHIRRILDQFRTGLERVAELDLRPIADFDPGEHEVLLQLSRWREAENHRLRCLLETTRRLPDRCPDPLGEEQRQQVRQRLLQARHLLSLPRG